MDPKKSPIHNNNLTRRLLTRQSTQANFREQPVKNINISPKGQKRLPRSNSNVSLSKLQQIENFMPKHLLQKNLDTYKLSNTPLLQTSDESLEQKRPSNALNKPENEVLNPNALFRGRFLKPPAFKKQNTSPFVVSSLLRNMQQDSPSSPANPQNSHFQKEGFDTLLSFFKRSSSKSPAKIFPGLKRMELIDAPKTPQHTNTPVIPERPSSIVQRIKTEGDAESGENGEQGNWAYVEQIISHLSRATGTVSTWKALDFELAKMMNKKKEEYWDELISEHKPETVEILVVDMIELMVKRHTEMEVTNGARIAERIENHIKEESPYQNEALHLLVYFHKKENKEKTLILSKYCFYFAKNSHFKEDLKGEKDVIIFYFLILGLCTFRMVLEHEPVRKIKIHLIKERAANILKGEETPSKAILEWAAIRFNNHTIVQKTFFNLNNISTLSSTYLFNIRSYIKSRYSKLSLLYNEDPTTKNDLTFIVRKANITQRSVVPYIQQLALPNSTSTRNLPQTPSTLNTGEFNGEVVNLGRKTPVLKKRTKVMSNVKERMSLRLDELNSRVELKSTKSTTIPSFFDTLSPKGNRTATFFYKPESKYETANEDLEEVSVRPEILNMKFKQNTKRNSSATPTLRRPRINTGNKTPQGQGNIAISPWLERPDSPVFDQSPILSKPHNLVLKSLAEELINEDEEHPSTLRLYLEEKENKGGKR